MNNKRLENNDSPVTIYNCTKQEIIGIFRTQSLAGRYLYSTKGSSLRGSNISVALLRKQRLLNTRFDFPVAVRRCNQTQNELLNGGMFLILNNYPQPKHNEMKGFEYDIEEIREEWGLKIKRKKHERNRQKEI